MPITTNDIKLFRPEVVADTDNGGGRMTGNEIIDGELNNLFDDTSRLDRVNGRASLRKYFGAVTTLDTEKYLGAHAILTRPPMDGRVACTLLDLDDHADRRTDAQRFVERYLIAGVETQLTLFSNQPAESRTVLAYQNAGDPPPTTGEVYVLSVEQVANANFGVQQFVRITSVAVQTVSVSGDAFTKSLYTLGISEPLAITYPGNDLIRNPQPSQRPTRLRRAEINPVANYYGIVPLAAEVEIGDTALQVSTILQPLVPASFAETPLLDRQIGASIEAAVAAGPSLTETFTQTATGGVLGVTLLRQVQPGSVTVTLTASNPDNSAVLGDAGGGVLTRSSGGPGTTTASGTVAYTAGQVNLSGLPAVAYTVAVAYLPSVAVSDVQHTSGVVITLANRGFNYTQTLIPKPAPGAVVVNYRTLGQWYALVDNGRGQLVGAPGTGAGTINYLTGTVNATLGYQPDVGGTVLFGWGTGVHYAQSVSALTADIGAVNGQLAAAQGLLPGTVEVSWNDGTARLAEDNGQGVLTGDATGTVNYATGAVELKPTLLVPAGTEFTVEALNKPVVIDTLTPTVVGDDVQFTLSDPPAVADTLFVEALYTRPNGDVVRVFFKDRAGAFQQRYGVAAGATGLVGQGTLRGSANLTTGACVLPRVLADAWRRYAYSGTVGNWSDGLENLTFSALADVRYTDAGGSETSSSVTLQQTSLRIDFSRGLQVGVVPGSLLFTLNGRRYFDNAGVLAYRDGAGLIVSAGSIDYLTGLGSLTLWLAGALTVSVQALLSKYGQWLLSEVVWRTEGEPLRSQSFQVTDGSNVASATSGNVIDSAFVDGTITLDDGVYRLTFAPAIVPELARYNAVALTYLPTDPDILGLNAVRLPLDGRVPVLRAGDTVVLLNDQTTALPNPVIAGTTYALPRERLASVVLYDANGLKVPTDRYSATPAELDAGEITMANPLDLSGYAQPLVAEHRVEDMVRCLDAQLSGDVQISGAITHDYPVLGSYLASAKLYGDLQAAVTSPFSQQAWTAVWSDAQIGNDTNGQYNVAANPFLVTNAGAITERWRIEFLSPTAFRLLGETIGQIATGDTSIAFSPINPATGVAYFVIPEEGWGAGWVAGNQVRFNTTACAAAGWVLRCTLQGPEEEPSDSFRIQFRGDN